ncbi:MAG: hypothetical protein RBR01_03395, partial [Desulfobacterales bacterium]|nr:hypothetical protein [Desulfobacterales bacterium]
CESSRLKLFAAGQGIACLLIKDRIFSQIAHPRRPMDSLNHPALLRLPASSIAGRKKAIQFNASD